MNVPESILDIFEGVVPNSRITELTPWFMFSGKAKYKSVNAEGYEQECLNALVDRLETEVNKPNPLDSIIEDIENTIEAIYRDAPDDGGYIVPDWIRDAILKQVQISTSLQGQIAHHTMLTLDQGMMQPRKFEIEEIKIGKHKYEVIVKAA